MSGFLGALSGGGMLVFIGILVLTTLLRAGRVSAAGVRDILWCAGVTFGIGLMYHLSGLLLQLAVFLDLPEGGSFTGVFRSGYLLKVYEALENPSFLGPVTGPFVYLGHAAGKLLFSQYHSGGLALSWGMALAAACLFYFRAKNAEGPGPARDLVFFLLTLPFGVFFFLPGCAPVLFLLAALLFSLLGRRFRFRLPFRLRGGAWWTLLSVNGLLSAFLTSLLALGRLA